MLINMHFNLNVVCLSIELLLLKNNLHTGEHPVKFCSQHRHACGRGRLGAGCWLGWLQSSVTQLRRLCLRNNLKLTAA